MLPENTRPHRRSGFTARLASFRFAFAGIGTLVLREPHARIHALATAVVVIAGLLRGLSRPQWIAVVLAMGLVWMAEALNTALEVICDVVVGERFHPLVKVAKDVAAGGVLLAAIAAAVVGALVFS